MNDRGPHLLSLWRLHSTCPSWSSQVLANNAVGEKCVKLSGQPHPGRCNTLMLQKGWGPKNNIARNPDPVAPRDILKPACCYIKNKMVSLLKPLGWETIMLYQSILRLQSQGALLRMNHPRPSKLASTFDAFLMVPDPGSHGNGHKKIQILKKQDSLQNMIEC